MSKIEQLLKKLCPDGVEYKKLGEIATDIYRGSGILRTQVTVEGVPCVRYGEIYTTYGVWFDTCVSHTKLEYIQSPKYFEHGDILFAITGESVEEIAKSTAYVGNEKCLAGGDIVVLKHRQNPKYLAYALSTIEAQAQKGKGKVKSKVVHSSVPSIKEILIPVPPLEIQREVVEVLDKFALLTAELTAELEKRKKQYEHYRRALLAEGNREQGIGNRCGVSNWPMVKLGEVCGSVSPSVKIKRLDYRETGLTPIVSQEIEYISGYCDLSDDKIPAGEYVCFGDHSEHIKYVNFAFVQGADGLKILKAKGGRVMAKFLYYVALAYYQRHDNYERHFKYFSETLVPLPPLAEQERIVKILDRFDKLCNDLTSGLPAEIAARKKQYEYYRDKLLSFKRAG